MSWSNFSKIKASLVFVFLFGAFTFFLGLTFNQLPNSLPNSLSDRDKQLISFIGAPAIILGFLALVNSRMLEEIEYDVKMKEMGLKIELDEKSNKNLATETQSFMEKYQEDIKKLGTAIKSLSPSEDRDKLLKIIHSLEFAEEEFKAQRDAAREIAKWLDIKENKSALLKAALDAVSEAKCDISKKYKPKFDQDIRQCINWLYDSVLLRRGCEVEPRHASALADIPEKYRPYEVALTAIQKYLEEEQELKKYNTKTPIVKIMLNELIKELKKKSSAS